MTVQTKRTHHGNLIKVYMTVETVKEGKRVWIQKRSMNGKLIKNNLVTIVNLMKKKEEKKKFEKSKRTTIKKKKKKKVDKALSDSKSKENDQPCSSTDAYATVPCPSSSAIAIAQDEFRNLTIHGEPEYMWTDI
ncbi:hypothetical protein AQUCO_02700170v1 [Aquilegia coerulea]|uniref:Uncharacterized protein n=1 Tax=Aquilegia coerulea TaxID=218851 RepID=A0A2G5D5I3_AQUCA|nr:hypothetical protein AQUCO_02700170v1 [Aquilegia coerulea]